MDLQTLRFTPTHEWVKIDGDVATVGISQFAVEQLTDLILIDLGKARPGSKLMAGQPFGEIESVKNVSDLYSPVGGEVLEVNAEVTADVQVLAQDPYDRGWLLKIRVTDVPGGLLDHDAYQRKIANDAH